ncbi:hypothetical protein [Acinetobacter sp. ANC 3813]|uniref:hypothetical protein n=1 Tax=Acinetobacter sp. ANC 3813 TaxID=1977873 RepID=UPI000A3380BC|nr:hypothetical protein [Acinetobacter sp. ANC 3813]OTG90071.1 hypothetical protein B9T34_09605 [Acinetobacter sp. ANC 3813]
MKLQFSFLLISALSALSGCMSSPVMSSSQREAYLQQFVGMSSNQIRNALDLGRIGYQQVSEPVLSGSALTYTASRAISIPVPMAQNPAMGVGAGSAVPIPSTAADRYDVNLNCVIRFQLEHNIAKAVYLTGRTC